MNNNRRPPHKFHEERDNLALKRVAYGFTNVNNLAARALLLTPNVATSP